IAPPVVRLDDGDVVRVETREAAQAVRGEIDEILFMGDVLVPYGEFLENGKDLLPSPYVVEWWAQDVEAALSDADTGMDLSAYITRPYEVPNVRTALSISRELDVPLHPAHTPAFDILDADAFAALHGALSDATGPEMPRDEGVKEALEAMHIPHETRDDTVIVDDDVHSVFTELLHPDATAPSDFTGDIRAGIADVSGITVREQAPVFLGNRMGRPEKAERRSLKGKPQFLFPCGRAEGGRLRNLVETNEGGTLETEILGNHCPDCNTLVPFATCPFCGAETVEMRKCRQCGETTRSETHCGEPASRSWEREVDVAALFDAALENLGMDVPPDLLKSPRRVTGRHKHVEPIEKGLLRQKHDLYVNKDGTVRYDATDLPLTHVRPKEINVSVERMRELGYETDVDGAELTSPDQLVELKRQDIVEEKEDLIGELVVGLAPHTSGGVVGRIIGFTEAKGVYAHPFWHAAKRRNADGDEDSVMLLMDALLNFSRQFLPDQRGTRTMDAPLILSTVLHPDEVDDESWNVDVASSYPRSFYEATHEFASPDAVDVPIAEDILDTEDGFGHTHRTTDIGDAPVESNYVTLGEMAEKVREQLSLGERIRAVDADHTAELLLGKHFLPDIRGNLRAFGSSSSGVLTATRSTAAHPCRAAAGTAAAICCSPWRRGPSGSIWCTARTSPTGSRSRRTSGSRS
ncbi:MAG: DNA polymerase II large subunit, partial [Candidatus Nanohaloarchaea archaeon]